MGLAGLVYLIVCLVIIGVGKDWGMVESAFFLSVFIAGPAAAFTTFKVAYRPNLVKMELEEQQFLTAFDEWSRSWICLRCGASWVFDR